jgi:FHA domain
MVYPQLYIGQIPATAAERRALRARALDLHAALRAARAPAPTCALLNFAAGDAPGATPATDLLLLRPNAVIVGAIRAFPGPIEVTPEGRWVLLATGAPIREGRGLTPLQLVGAQRDAVRDRLDQEAAHLLGPGGGGRPFERTIGALICVPTAHPESRISLDVDDHRRWLKVLGLDELAGLAAMARTGVWLDEESMRVIAGDLFGGRLWHDGQRLLFELAPGRFQLCLLTEDGQAERILPLAEGENVVGRRRVAQAHEPRVRLDGDDLVSSDHARIICGDDDHVILRDTSKNGTWVAQPGEPEERVHSAEYTIGSGALLRMGMTRMRLERIDDG